MYVQIVILKRYVLVTFYQHISAMGNKIGSACEGDKRSYLPSISSALSVNSAVNLTLSR